MKNEKLQIILTNELDISILDKDFYITILNKMLELKKQQEVQK